VEPFSISCTTCQARLRVRDEAAIGQILACPKCGSMVLVEAPSEATPESGPTGEPIPASPQPKSSSKSLRHAKSPSGKAVPPGTQAPPPDQSAAPQTPASATPPAEPLGSSPNVEQKGLAAKSGVQDASNASAAPTGPTAPSTRPGRTFKFREDFEPLSDAPESRKPRSPATPAPPRQAGASPPSEIDENIPPDTTGPIAQETAVSPTTRRYQQWLLIAGAAVIGITLAVLVLGLLSSKGSQPSTTSEMAQQDSLESTGTHQDHAGGKPASETKRDSNDDRDVPQDSKPTSGDPEDADAEVAGSSSANSELPSPKDLESSDTDSTGATPESANEAPVDDTLTDVSHADLPPGILEPDDSALAAGKRDAAAEPAINVGPDVPPPAESVVDDADTRGVVLPRDTLEQQLKFPFVAIEFSTEDDVALADFTDFLSNVTTLPLTLDMDALRAARINVEQRIELELRGATVQQALETVLAPLEAAYSVGDGGIVISAQRPVRSEFSTEVYEVADLVSGASGIERLAQYVRQLVAPPSWSDLTGASMSVADGQLEVTQTVVVQYQIARFLDRLRAMRGLLPRSELPRDMLATTPAFVQAAGKLDLPVPASFPEPIALRQFFAYVQTQSDLRLLVDWTALLKQGIDPTHAIPLGEPERPVHQLLHRVLDPLELDYRVLDGHSLEISTREAIQERPEVELYRLVDSRGTQAEALVAEFTSQIGKSFFAEDAGTGAMFHDPLSESLLVSLPQPQQRTLAEWLSTHDKIEFPESAEE